MMAVVLSPVVAVLASLVGDQRRSAVPLDRSLSCAVVRHHDPVDSPTPVGFGSSFERPVLIRRVAPKRPAHFRGSGRVVVLEFVVSAAGRVEAPCVVVSDDPALELEAVKAVRRWRFNPARVDGRPVKAFTTVTVDFGRIRG
jgi:TonB family protein